MMVFNPLLIEVFITLLITIDPPGVIGPFLTLTSDYQIKDRHRILKQAILFSIIILIASMILGKTILDLLGISLFALQIAGGILFFKFGYETLEGRKIKNSLDEEDPGLVPLGFPIIAGPGSITAVIVIASTHNTRETSIFLIVSILTVLAITFIILRHSSLILKTIGERATKAIIKIIGLLIMTIGVQLILTGLQQWVIQMQLLS